MYDHFLRGLIIGIDEFFSEIWYTCVFNKNANIVAKTAPNQLCMIISFGLIIGIYDEFSVKSDIHVFFNKNVENVATNAPGTNYDE